MLGIGVGEYSLKNHHRSGTLNREDWAIFNFMLLKTQNFLTKISFLQLSYKLS